MCTVLLLIASAPTGPATPPSPSKSKHKKSSKKKSSDSDPGETEGGRGRKGVAPPPPLHRRKTQPEFMQELEKEVKNGRRNKEAWPGGGVAAGTDTLMVNGAKTTPSTTTHPTVRTDGVQETALLCDEITEPPILEMGGATSADSPRKVRGSQLKPRTRPPPTPPSNATSTSVPEEVGRVKGQPPLVSSKPHPRIPANVGVDEPDFATPPGAMPFNEEPSEEEREEPSKARAREDLTGREGSITNALREQAGGRLDIIILNPDP